MMKFSDSWFSARSAQGMVQSGVSSLVVFNSVGPNNNSEPMKETDDDGNKFFIVGDSEVGSVEVVG
jgi:hypothetical protein